jgi:hypothetical protein
MLNNKLFFIPLQFKLKKRNMKKLLLIIGMGLILGSCSKDELLNPIDPNSGQTISLPNAKGTVLCKIDGKEVFTSVLPYGDGGRVVGHAIGNFKNTDTKQNDWSFICYKKENSIDYSLSFVYLSSMNSYSPIISGVDPFTRKILFRYTVRESGNYKFSEKNGKGSFVFKGRVYENNGDKNSKSVMLEIYANSISVLSVDLSIPKG